MLRSTHFKPTCMILVVGSANLNCAVRAHQIPALPRRNRAGTHFNTWPSGQGAKQAVACAQATRTQRHRCSKFRGQWFFPRCDTWTPVLENLAVVDPNKLSIVLKLIVLKDPPP